MPRIAYQAEDEADFYRRLDRMMDIAARSLKIKRNVISKLLDEGLYPYTKRYLGTFDNHFSTIGLIGMNEAGLNAKWLRADLTHAETQKFTRMYSITCVSVCRIIRNSTVISIIWRLHLQRVQHTDWRNMTEQRA